MGRGLYEAVVAMTVLEKSAEVSMLAEKIGGAVPISKRDAKLMRKEYEKELFQDRRSSQIAEVR